MFGGKKRPWKDYASIQRTELNSGDVKFRTQIESRHFPPSQYLQAKEAVEKEFESLDAAEAHLSEWWSAWWPAQTRKVRKV